MLQASAVTSLPLAQTAFNLDTQLSRNCQRYTNCHLAAVIRCRQLSSRSSQWCQWLAQFIHGVENFCTVAVSYLYPNFLWISLALTSLDLNLKLTMRQSYSLTLEYSMSSWSQLFLFRSIMSASTHDCMKLAVTKVHQTPVFALRF